MEYIKVNNLTEEEYIESLAEVYVKNSKIAKVKENFLASLEVNEEEKEQKLNEYIAELTQKETIEYK